MSQLATAIHQSLQLSLGYAERLLTEITADQFARFATPGGKTVVSNHGAFVYGHLSLYPSRILTQLGVEATPVPAKFEDVFSKDATCTDDPESNIYPAMEEITSVFFDGYKSAGKAIVEAVDETLLQPNHGSGRIVELFPTLGSMHNFYVGGHMMIHMGQMSAWRRMLGLGPA
jgi:hypothetical protein